MKTLKFVLTVFSGALTALLIADLYPEILGRWEAVKSPAMVTTLWLVVWGIQGWVFPYPESKKHESVEEEPKVWTPPVFITKEVLCSLGINIPATKAIGKIGEVYWTISPVKLDGNNWVGTFDPTVIIYRNNAANMYYQLLEWWYDRKFISYEIVINESRVEEEVVVYDWEDDGGMQHSEEVYLIIKSDKKKVAKKS